MKLQAIMLKSLANHKEKYAVFSVLAILILAAAYSLQPKIEASAESLIVSDTQEPVSRACSARLREILINRGVCRPRPPVTLEVIPQQQTPSAATSTESISEVASSTEDVSTSTPEEKSISAESEESPTVTSEN